MGLFGKDRKKEMRELVQKGREVYIDHRDGKLSDQDLAQAFGNIREKNLWRSDPRRKRLVDMTITESMRGNINIDEAADKIYEVAYSESTDTYCFKCGYVHVAPACDDQWSW